MSAQRQECRGRPRLSRLPRDGGGAGGNGWSLPSRRRVVVERLRNRLLRTRWPRLQMSAIAALTGASGFVASWVLLAFGLDSMALRYGLAVLVAYGAFLLLVRIWL